MKRTIIRSFLVFCATLLLVIAGIWYFVGTASGAAVILGQAFDHYAGVGTYRWSAVEGNFLSGITIRDVEITNLRFLPADNLVRVSEVRFRIQSLSRSGVDAEFLNARLLFAHDDPIVADGRIVAGRLTVNAYTRSFNLRRIPHFLPGFKYLSAIKGDLKDVDLVIEGEPPLDFSVRGKSSIGRWTYGDYIVENCPLEKELHFVHNPLGWQIEGKVNISGGSFYSPHAKTAIQPSRIFFNGDPLKPSFDIKGEARVARMNVGVKLKGTRDKPELVLSSDPSLPQEELLFLLATGKRWNSMNGAMSAQKMTPELTADFVDYFLFGGSGRLLAEKLGLSDISVRFDQNVQGVGIGKDITDRVGVGYNVRMTTPSNAPREISQTVEGEYDVTNKVTFGLQKEIIGAEDQGSGGATPERVPDDRIFLKYRTRF